MLSVIDKRPSRIVSTPAGADNGALRSMLRADRDRYAAVDGSTTPTTPKPGRNDPTTSGPPTSSTRFENETIAPTDEEEIEEQTVANANMTDDERMLETLIAGQMYVSSYNGTSQYSSGGPSACGLASMNAVMHAITYHKKGIRGLQLLSMMNKLHFHEVCSVSYLTSNN